MLNNEIFELFELVFFPYPSCRVMWVSPYYHFYVVRVKYRGKIVKVNIKFFSFRSLPKLQLVFNDFPVLVSQSVHETVIGRSKD